MKFPDTEGHHLWYCNV